MAPLLPINPDDFPEVPTRKAFIALDLQNDFLAEDGALPVTQPDGMVARIISLAAAVRASGYGEVIWVRSQFDTARPAGEQQLVVETETPVQPRGSAAPSQRTERPPPPAAALEGDVEAFLSAIECKESQAEQQQPVCVRKGTKGVELLPAIAAAKGPNDYAMTKSHYSAFQSGQLLNLLRGQFATEIIICGALSNVSVYATALAASAYGLDITVVEDCCGYRSERRHKHAARRLMDQTGCVFADAVDVLTTLRPRSPVTPTPGRGLPPRSPAPPLKELPLELIAAAVAGKGERHGGNSSIPVRPRPPNPSPPPLIPNPDGGAVKGETKARAAPETPAAKEEDEARGENKTATTSLSHSPPSPSSADLLLVSMEKLKLSTDHLPEPATATASTSGQEKDVAAILERQREDDSPQTWEHVVAWDVRA